MVAMGDLPHPGVAQPGIGFAALRATLLRFEAQFRLPDAADHIGNPALLGRIRGALGAQLRETASLAARAGQPCPWSPPCAYDQLWRGQGDVRPGFPIPAPYVIEADADGADLIVTLRLFGRAGDLLGEVADAVLRGLRLGLSGIGPLEPTDRDLRIVEGCTPILASHDIELTFLTPLLLRAENAAHIDPTAFLRSLILRCCGIGWWCDLDLTPDIDGLLAATDLIQGMWQSVETTAWTRTSSPQRRRIPMEGWLGELHLSGSILPLADVLALGSVTHAGSRTAWGLGRYQIGGSL